MTDFNSSSGNDPGMLQAMSEDLLRKLLRRHGYRLEKTPAWHWTRAAYGPGYQILDDRNVIVLGCGSREFEATLAEAVDWAVAKFQTENKGNP